ncbi:MAG: DNA repair protein RecN [Geminicoccaceae bacterium]|nr:MAG: DNA repair protein RecN [Geminicoccaceae bacterium]
MLVALSIRDVVIIESLDLGFGAELGVLTGETGAGKSILLDALGLACGWRADRSIVRTGAERAQVTAVFALASTHEVRSRLAEAGLAVDEPELVLRRVVQADGKSRAFVNDQPVTLTLLRSVGADLVEVHGQHDQQGLFDRAVQRDLLDDYGGHDALRDACAAAHAELSEAEADRARLLADVERARRDEDYLRHRLAELEALAPEPGEEERLAAKRANLLGRAKLDAGLDEALAMVAGSDGAADRIARAERALERLGDGGPGRIIAPSLEALERARLELVEAEAALDEARAQLAGETGDVAAVEERLFALKDAARKHRTTVDGLGPLFAETGRLLQGLEDASGELARAETRVRTARDAQAKAVAALSEARHKAAGRLAAAVAHELPPLKLERVRFAVEVTAAPGAAGPHGGDRIAFLVATNPGQAPGPIERVASGGELSRIMLALKVVLARLGHVPTLIFDEIDSGIGGAVADAVGERLARLGQERQVLVVTHAPQVAARARHHLQVAKSGDAAHVRLTVTALDGAARQEEIARMLAGAKVTEAARAAAASLLAADAVA